MGCSFCDDCADCTVGGGLDCSEWDPAEHRGSFYDDDWYDDWHEDETGEEQFSRSTGAEDFLVIDENERKERSDDLHCVGCGEEVRSEWNYCLKCGAAIPIRYCTGCGEKLITVWKYCPMCGKAISPDAQPSGTSPFVACAPAAPVIDASCSVYDDDIPY